MKNRRSESQSTRRRAHALFGAVLAALAGDVTSDGIPVMLGVLAG